jgi:hypothetical protein
MLNMAVGQKCVLGFGTRGDAPGYVEYGRWPKMQI